MTPATIDAEKMPSFAASSVAPSGNARLAMNSDTVKPMPPTAAAPTRWPVCTPSGSRASRRRVARRAPPVIPAIFPTTSPAMTARATRLSRRR